MVRKGKYPWDNLDYTQRTKEEQSGGTVDWPFMLCTLNVMSKVARIFTT